MADSIAASLSLEFALRSEQALDALKSVEDKLVSIEQKILNLASGSGKKAIEGIGDSAVEVGRKFEGSASKIDEMQKLLESLSAFRTQQIKVGEKEEEVYKDIVEALDSEVSTKKMLNNLRAKDPLNLKMITDLVAQHEKLPAAMKKALAADEQRNKDWKKLEDLSRRINALEERKNKLFALGNTILSAGGKALSGLTDNWRKFGGAMAAQMALIDLVAEAWADADKYITHYSKGMYRAAGSTMQMARAASTLQNQLGITADEAIKAQDAVVFAGFRGESIQTISLQVASMAKAYNISEEAAADYAASVRVMTGSNEKASESLEEFYKNLSITGLKSDEATAAIKQITDATRMYYGVYGSGSVKGEKASKAYAEGLMQISAAARAQGLDVATASKAFDQFSKGGADNIMALRSAAFDMGKTDAFQKWKIAVGNLEKNLKKLTKDADEKLIQLPDIGNALLQGYKPSDVQDMIKMRDKLKDPEFVKKMKEQQSIQDAIGESMSSGSESVKAFMQSLQALLGIVLVPLNYILGKIIYAVSVIQRSLGDLRKKLEDVFGEEVVANTASIGGNMFAIGAAVALLIKGLPFMAKSIGWVGSAASSTWSSVKLMGSAFRSLIAGQGGIKGFFATITSSTQPAAEASDKLAEAGQKMKGESGEGIKKFLTNFSDGLKSFGKIDGKGIALNIVLIGGALLLLAAGIVFIAKMVKDFGIAAADFGLAAAAMLVGALLMLAVIKVMAIIGAVAAGTGPLLLYAAAAIAVIGVAMLIAAAAGYVFAMAFETMMAAWDSGKAWELLGWMVVAGAAFLAFGWGLSLAAPGLLSGGGALIIAAAGVAIFGLALSLVDPTKVSELGISLMIVAGGMILFTMATLAFARGVLIMGGAVLGLAAAMLIFPNSAFADAAKSFAIWASAMGSLPDDVSKKVSGIKDALREMKGIRGMDAKEAEKTADVLNMLSPAIERFTEAMRQASLLDSVADKFSAAVAKIMKSIDTIKELNNSDFAATVGVATTLQYAMANAEPLATTRPQTVSNSNGSSRIETLLSEQNQILNDINNKATERGAALKDILTFIKTNMPDVGSIGKDGSTPGASRW